MFYSTGPWSSISFSSDQQLKAKKDFFWKQINFLKKKKLEIGKKMKFEREEISKFNQI